MTQSNAILRYLARTHGLDGSTEEEKARVDLIAEQSTDFRDGMVYFAYDKDFVSSWFLRYYYITIVIGS